MLLGQGCAGKSAGIHDKSCNNFHRQSKGGVVKSHLLSSRTGRGEPWSALLFRQHLTGGVGWDGMKLQATFTLEGEWASAGKLSCILWEHGCCGFGGAELSPCFSWVRWVRVCPPKGMQVLMEIKMGRR